MNKKLLALAVAAALAPAAAMADSGNVVISGKIAADVTFVNGTGQTAAADNNTHQVNNNNSVLTLSGNEDLGNGNKAFFSLTYGLPMSSAGALAGQNQIIGLEGKTWGKVFAGAFDNPLKVMGRATDLFADQSTGDARTLTNIGLVEARANDVVAYVSPSFNGFQAVLAHSNNPAATTEAKDGLGGEAGKTTAMNIIKLTYANGPLSLALGRHTVDTEGAAAASGKGDETATRITGSYVAGDFKVVGSWQDVNNVPNTYTAATTTYTDFKVWGLGAAYKMGATTLKGQYYKLTNDGTNDVANATHGANMLALGADYAMSKRTTLQLAYSKVNNDASATYGGNSGVWGADNLTIAGGSDPRRLSLGMKHTF